METGTLLSPRHNQPILSMPKFKVDSQVENDFEIITPWCENEKVKDPHLEYNGEESSSDDEFVESASIGRIKNEKEESDLHLDKSSYIECEIRQFEKILVKPNDRKLDNDVMEPRTIKKETNNLNEELSYSHGEHFEPEHIVQGELHIKDENSLNEKILNPNKQLELYQCPECPYSTRNKGNLKGHSIRHKKEDKIDWYRCQECPYKTSRKSDLKYHRETHNSLILKCLKCSYETSRPLNLRRHQIKHKSSIHCPECSYKTHLQSSLQRHSLVHKSEAFKCPNCSYRARTKGQLTIHQVKHESIDKWSFCPLCPYKTYNIKSIKRHNLECHSIGPNNSKQIKIFECTECSYKSGLKHNLKIHQLIHNQSHWFQCPNCAFKTPHKSSLKIHQMGHQEENMKCWHRCLECSYKTPHKAFLRSHAKSHKAADEIQWFECSQCSFKTAYKTNLKPHELKHKESHEIEWFYCYECDYKTKYKSCLPKHMSRHHKRKFIK